MAATQTADAEEIAAKPIDPDIASFVRPIMTFFGLHRACAFKVCRRAEACATRHVVCYQALDEEMKPIVQSIRARMWMLAVARGEELDVPPGDQDDMLRVVAREDEELEQILSGGFGGDERLTPHQLFLKNFVAEYALPRARPMSTDAPAPLPPKSATPSLRP